MSDKLREVEVFFTVKPNLSLLVGTLAIQRHRLFFEYSPDWLQRNLQLSPFHLPLKSGLFEHKQREFGPLFGLFDDSLPDGWGLMLMDRHFRKAGIEPASLTPLDRLQFLGKRTMGALTYRPPAVVDYLGDKYFDLDKLASNSRKIIAGKDVEILPSLLRAGGSPGGARPKILVGFNPVNETLISGEDDLSSGFEHWIIKFSAKNDALDAGLIEYSYALMATAAGLKMPAIRLFKTRQGDAFFGVKRFDRDSGNRRYHIHTFSNLIQTNFRIPACDYGDLFKVVSILTRNHADLLQAFRLMVFNVLSHNRDDHGKNFSFRLDDTRGQWVLSPAYDLTFSYGPGGEHSTTVAGEGLAPAMAHFVKLAEACGISAKEVKEITDEVGDAIKQWSEFAEKTGVARSKIKHIAAYLAG
ncbi:MAG: type II toxin-antitoxin system HipA family toxin [Pseudomonadota bacterium]|nr:type II toxin-antitoxin system HipA family toxin [Pseudomonadota bacterium]